MDIYGASFNGYQLNVNDYTDGIKWHDFDRMPDAERSISPVTSANRSVSTNERWVQKTAQIVILTKGCPKNVLDAHIARIRQVLQRKGSLVIQKGVPILDNGSYEYDQYETLTYTSAVVDGVEFDTEGYTSIITIDFILLDPIAKGSNIQTIYSGTHTTDTTIIDISSVDIQGTLNVQYPVYTLVYNSVTLGSEPSLSIYNGFNTITINHAFVNGDELVIDTDKMLVTLNTELIDFNGVFPNISNNTPNLVITDTYTARNISIDVKNTPRYI